MDAVVTVKMTATEFDTMRRALEGFADREHGIVASKDSTPGARAVARQNEAQTRDLLDKLAR